MLPNNNLSMTDIHMHLIPGVDDGAADLNMAIVMLVQAQEQGIAHIFATPHSEAFDREPEVIKPRYDQLCAEVRRLGLPMKISFGCEVYCEVEMMDDVVKALNTGLYPTMNDTRYVLVEFFVSTDPGRMSQCLQALVNANYKPIVAHAERYDRLCDKMDYVDRFRELGALIQVNAYSLVEEEKDHIRNWARKLIQEKKADFFGTDAHRTYHRPPSAAMGLQWLYDHADLQYADAVAWGNARTYLL